jgi:hypothetical protein
MLQALITHRGARQLLPQKSGIHTIRRLAGGSKLGPMGLFGNKQNKAEQDTAAKAEADRLVALPVPDLAAEVLPAFGADGPGKGDKEIGTFQVAMFLMKDYPRGNQLVKQLLDPVREAFQALENSGLIMAKIHNTGISNVIITRAGTEALATGTAAQLLK